MWSEKTANGKVKFVERYKDPLTDKMERVSVTMEKNTASTRKQATTILNQRIEELINAPQSGLTQMIGLNYTSKMLSSQLPSERLII